jgi:hypothetical protein
MSTKSSLAHGEHFHFYNECFDEKNVYLKLENTEFEVYQTQRPNTNEFSGRIMVRIPLETWITIQHVKPPHMDLADKNDQQLLEMVRHEVNERVARYKAASTDRQRALESAMASFVYGPADKARSVQIRRGLTHVTRQRNQQRDILERSKANWISTYATNVEEPVKLTANPTAAMPTDES